MKKTVFSRIIGLFVLTAFSCGSAPAVRYPEADANYTPSMPSPSVQSNSLFFTGDGGRGTRLTVLIPTSNGLADDQGYLLTMIQSALADDFTKYSAINVMTPENLEKVLRETESGIYKDDADFGRLGEITGVDYAMTGSVTRTSSGYAVQVQVVGTKRDTVGVAKAGHSGSFSIAELDDFTGIRRISMDLLGQMGVSLTERARLELTGAASDSQVNARIALAQGRVTERQGTEIGALSYYFQAEALDPSLIEAANRSSILNANITSGNIGADVRNDIQWRRDWVARLTETEQFFSSFSRSNSMAYTLYYATEITQGPINYQNETVNLSIETHLHGSGIWTLSLERALQAVYDGLQATGRTRDWSLNDWPRQGVTNLNAFARQSSNFTVIFELVNEQNVVIGRSTLQSGGYWEFNRSGRPLVSVSADVRRTLNFQNVSANDISTRMTIRVATVNGINAETAARDGILQIRASDKIQFDGYDRYRFERGELRGFANNNARVSNLVIPDTIWGDPVVSIGERAFRNSSLNSVTIPASVSSIGPEAFANNSISSITLGNGLGYIGDGAFADNQLGSINIPASVRSIGARAFQNNRFTSIVIPDSVTTIGERAFETQRFQNREGERRYRFTSITIGANVRMAENSFRDSWSYYTQNGLSQGVNDSFPGYYNQNGRKAGVYTFFDGKWVYDMQGDNTNLNIASNNAKVRTGVQISILVLLLGGLVVYRVLNPPEY